MEYRLRFMRLPAHRRRRLAPACHASARLEMGDDTAARNHIAQRRPDRYLAPGADELSTRSSRAGEAEFSSDASTRTAS